MAVLIACPSCQRKLRLTDNMLGRQIRCPACSTTFPATGVPAEPPAVPAAEEQSAVGPEAVGTLPARPDGYSALVDYLTFRRMVTPLIIQVLFWLGVAFCVFFGTALVVVGLTHQLVVDVATVLIGLVLTLLGPVLVRIACEATIVFFRIHETLAEIKDRVPPIQ